MCPAEPFVLSGGLKFVMCFIIPSPPSSPPQKKKKLLEFFLVKIMMMSFLTGKDKSVVLWSIQDHVSTLATDGTQSAESASSIVKAADNSTVGPRGVFHGHSDTVEDVQFCPSR